MAMHLTLFPNIMFNIKLYSCRRRLLDQLLFFYLMDCSGYLLDLGGKRYNSRGKFSSAHLRSNTIVINTDASALPDYVGEITDFDIPESYFDYVLCLETLEYVLSPETLLSAVKRVLIPGGYLFLSVPFMHRLHGDDHFDMFRFTPAFLSHILSDFSEVQIIPMGGPYSVVVDFIISSQKVPFILKVLLSKFMKLTLSFPSKNSSPSVTTGFFIVAKKP